MTFLYMYSLEYFFPGYFNMGCEACQCKMSQITSHPAQTSWVFHSKLFQPKFKYRSTTTAGISFNFATYSKCTTQIVPNWLMFWTKLGLLLLWTIFELPVCVCLCMCVCVCWIVKMWIACVDDFKWSTLIFLIYAIVCKYWPILKKIFTLDLTKHRKQWNHYFFTKS